MEKMYTVRCRLVGNVLVEAGSKKQAIERVREMNELDVIDEMYDDTGKVEVLSASLYEDQ